MLLDAGNPSAQVWLQLGLINDAIHRFQQAHDLTSFWDTVCENLRWIFQTEKFAIVTKDRANLDCVRHAHKNRILPQDVYTVPFSCPDEWIDWAQNKRPQWIEVQDLSNDAKTQRHILSWLAQDTKTLLSLPFLSRGEWIGALLCAFNKEDLDRVALAAYGMTYASQICVTYYLLQAHDDQLRTQELEIHNTHLEERNRDFAFARDEAIRAQNAQRRNLANLSHELRTPLNAIVGFAELILEESESTQDINAIQRDTAKILDASSHLLYLVNNLLDWSKLTEGKDALEKTTFPVQPLVEELLAFSRPLLLRQHNLLSWNNSYDGDLTTDRRKLFQILLNFMSNASKFTDHGEVSLHVTKQEDELGDTFVVFHIKDTGRGMSKEEMSSIFEAFEQASAQKNTQRGTGLGLSICSHLAELLQAHIEVESAPNKGSTFSLHVPIQT